MNNKGYLVVELVVSFAISTVVMALILSTAINLKNKSDNLAFETNILVLQATTTREIENDLINFEITNIDVCGEYCINITYLNNGTNLIKKLEIDPFLKTIEYSSDDKIYKKKLLDVTEFGNITIKVEKVSDSELVNNSIFYIDIPIYHKILDKNYRISTIYQYNDSNNKINEFEL